MHTAASATAINNNHLRIFTSRSPVSAFVDQVATFGTNILPWRLLYRH
jgi:hypothetical protein